MITDKQRIDWLQKHGRDGWKLITDDAGRWCVSIAAIQFIAWQPTVRKAIDKVIKEVK